MTSAVEPVPVAGTPPTRVRRVMDRDALSEVVELALWAGRLLMEHGAETQRVEEGVRSIGIGLGCEWGNVVITHGAIIVTYGGGGDFRTKIHSVKPGGVDMSLIEAVSHLCHRADEGRLSAAQVRSDLARIEAARPQFGVWQTTLAAGLGCGAFCRLFDGDWAAVGVTFLASGVGMVVRSAGARRGYNPFLVCGATAFVAASIVGLVHPGRTPAAALAASVVLLVPGPALINSVEDVIKGHIIAGLARATFAALILVFATLGLVLAMALTATGL
jgi:uncharacterized membrane protein YjjP (DUF1212 family)